LGPEERKGSATIELAQQGLNLPWEGSRGWPVPQRGFRTASEWSRVLLRLLSLPEDARPRSPAQPFAATRAPFSWLRIGPQLNVTELVGQGVEHLGLHG
jgi:hypothetical protein